MLVGINLAVGVHFGAMQITVAAFAVGHGAAGAAPALYAVSSFSGVLAGWLYGMRRWRVAPALQLAVVTAAMTLACLPLLLAGSVLELGLALAVLGVTIPPTLVLCTVLTEEHVRRGVLVQAFTWLASASAAGSAAAAATAGLVLEAVGPRAGLGMAAVAAATMAGLAATGAALRVRP